MTKADIVNEIAKTTGIDKPAVLSVVEQFMSVVKDSLAHGENVYLRGFGSFIVKTRAEKTARNSAECQEKRSKYVTILDVDRYIESLNDWD